MPASDPELHERLVTIVRRSVWFMRALDAVRELGLASWCIGAGTIRNLVWDALHHIAACALRSDVDVAYFDAANLTRERDAELQCRLTAIVPDVPWEVTNQAGVHLWFKDCFGHAVPSLSSLEEAIASWPEYATCIGLTLRADDTIEVIAPHGLVDLLSMVIRRNPARVSVETYRQRVAQRRYTERWPLVRIVPC